MKTAFEGAENCILELRNDRDQRHGLQYLRVANPDAAALVVAAITGDRDADSPDGYVNGTRYVVRRDS